MNSMNGIMKLLDVNLHCFRWWWFHFFASPSSSRHAFQFFVSNSLEDMWNQLNHKNFTEMYQFYCKQTTRTEHFVYNFCTQHKNTAKIKGGEKRKKKCLLFVGGKRDVQFPRLRVILDKFHRELLLSERWKLHSRRIPVSKALWRIPSSSGQEGRGHTFAFSCLWNLFHPLLSSLQDTVSVHLEGSRQEKERMAFLSHEIQMNRTGSYNFRMSLCSVENTRLCQTRVEIQDQRNSTGSPFQFMTRDSLNLEIK